MLPNAETSSRPAVSAWERWTRLLASPVSGGSLAVMRVALGLIMVLESVSFFLPSESSGGQSHLDVYYTARASGLYFPYEPFSWLPLLPVVWIRWLCVLMGVGGFLMALGLFYRVAVGVTLVCWGYLYAVECTRTYWMSYFYLELLCLGMMFFMPAAACFSVDAWRRRMKAVEIPFWPIFLLRAQLVISYFYAGWAKINSDWLLGGVPVRVFLDKPWVIERLQGVLPGVGVKEATALVHSPALIHFLGWAGAGFDLVVGLLLVLPRTRVLGCVMMLIFHSFNHFILFTDIGWFPLLGVTTATIFLDPDWPQRLVKWMGRPRIVKPEWKWFVGGAILLPLVGAALGWKKRSAPWVPSSRPLALRSCTIPLLLTYLVFQVLMPLRHYLIPGDARFTFEGLPWSWRLKTEVYRCGLGVISITDRELQRVVGNGPAEFAWEKWPEERVLYRKVVPAQLDWKKLPEIFVVFEPRTGDRILYNAQAAPAGVTNAALVTARVNELWTALHGRKPDLVGPTAPLMRVLEGYQKAMQRRGRTFGSMQELMNSFNQVSEENGEAERRMPVLRRIDPFAWSSSPPGPGQFFLIEDRQLLKDAKARIVRLDASKWRDPGLAVRSSAGGATAVVPLVVHHSELGVDEGEILPAFYVTDSWEEPGQLPVVRWNLLRDAGISKAMHVSMQPFLLRRYADRVAEQWEKAHGRRPGVHALTSVSLNLHSPQPVVDPQADLASVRTVWFGHNAWILDFKPSGPTAGDRSEVRLP